MAAYLDKEMINTAITDSTKFDLSHVHLTTANFMQLSPIYNKEMVPGEKLDVNIETFSRMNPLPVPTFGRANIKNRAYFVPFRTIFRAWNDFITDAPHAGSDGDKTYAGTLINKVPTVSNNALIGAMTTVSYAWNGGSHGTVVKWDYAAEALDSSSSLIADFVLTNGGQDNRYQFTGVGRQINKILESLGYKVNWNTADETEYSALPLLAFAKVYIDWYFPSAYTDAVEYNYIKLLLNADYGTSGISLNATDVGRILQMCYTCYDSDYFVSAFDSPNQPHKTVHSDFKLVNIDTAQYQFGTFQSNSNSYGYGEKGYVTNNSGGSSASNHLGYVDAPFISPYANDSTGSRALPTPISQYLLHSLHALTDYMKRHQLAGSRAMDRYLARFGKALSAEKLNRSVYLGCQTVPVQFGDIMATADTSTAMLGDYAGKGVAYSDSGNFTFSTDEFGMFIVVSTVTPATGYFQGINRNVKHVSKLEYWTPEFDNLGNQPITCDELYVTNNGGNTALSSADVHNSIFGFAPRYAEYKVPFDQVTGNFRIPSLHGTGLPNNGAASWHLMRQFDDDDWTVADASGNVSYTLDAMKHNINFVYSRGDLLQYDRIFAAPESQVDNFIVVHNFNIASYAPMKPLYDTYEFEEKGKKVQLDVNGVKHN